MPTETATRFPTSHPEALKDFVDGQEQYHAYLVSGRSDDLEQASRLFGKAAERDSDFDLAIFYHALTLAQRREADNAIQELQRLVDRKVEFLAEVYLHKAYAHIKKYENDHFEQAESALDQALAHARGKKQKTAIEVYRVFLWAVMGGNLKKERVLDKPEYVSKAIELGERLWRRKLWGRVHSPILKFELHNALGIAYMRKGQQDKRFSDEQEEHWRQACDHYQQALDLKLNPVRVRQNIGTLRRIQGDQLRAAGKDETARSKYLEAIEEYQASIRINALDQFPHRELAQLHIQLREWDLALRHVKEGRDQPGSFKPETWDRLEAVIAAKNPDLLNDKPGLSRPRPETGGCFQRALMVLALGQIALR